MPFYRQLIKQTKDSLTERHLQILWLEQKHFPSLCTAEGERIQVLSPGIWNKQAGPDFLKAHLRIGNRDYRGDIEIHLTDKEWYQHQHHFDPRYNHVILHVSYEKSPTFQPIYKENGQLTLNSYLKECLTQPLEEILSVIDLDLYLNQEFAAVGDCASRLFAHLSEKAMRSLFQSAAYWRLDKKLRHLTQAFPDQPSLQFAGGVAMALGYRQNAVAFLELFLALLPIISFLQIFVNFFI